MQYLIGVDLGTQGTKTTLCDTQGAVCADAFVDTALRHPVPGAVEQDPDELLESVLAGIKAVVEKSGIASSQVAAVAICGQMAGIMGVKADGSAATPYDSWLDVRCSSWRAPFLSFGEERVIALTGGPVGCAHGPKILWWKHERPDTYAHIYKFVQPAAYCTMRMCGLDGDAAFIDHTYLHFTGFADTKARRWSSELLDALQVSAEKMPRIVSPATVVGTLSPDAAARCGLPDGVAMVAGCGDTAASIYGAGVVKSGLMFDVAGTASVLAAAVEQFVPDTRHKTIMFAPSVIDGLYTPMAYINGGGLCLKWFRDDVLGGRFDYTQLDAMAGQVPHGSENLLFLPHFSGRVCPSDPDVRGAYVNLGWKHGTAHMYRAIMESIALEYRQYMTIIRELMPQVAFQRIISVGGGSKSRLFSQIKSDVLQMPVSTIRLADTASIGCCVIAGHGAGIYPELAEPVQRMAAIHHTVHPTEEAAPVYDRLDVAYRGLCDALHDTVRALQCSDG